MPKETTLPSRVLDVGSADSVTLLETTGKLRKYLALSHCCGLSHRIITTLANISEHKEGIQLSTLPTTFQNAVSIARLLRIPYVWIDSLCIVHDSSDDWESESTKMDEVYANAYLTISASSSVDDSSGCFPSMAARSRMHVSSDETSLGRPCLGNAAPLIGLNTKDPRSKEPMYYSMQQIDYFD